MIDRLVLLLPEHPAGTNSAAHWWHLSGQTIVSKGSDPAWQALVAPPTGGPGLPLTALVPAVSVRLGWPMPEGATDRQRLGIARADALRGGMANPATLHAVADMVEDRLSVAIVANGSMIEWLDWLSERGADPVDIVPIGLLLPRSEGWTAATLGPERLLRKGDLLVPDEPSLREALVESEEVADLTEADVAERLLFLAEVSPLTLRTGRFARRRLFVLDWRRVRELIALAVLIPLLGLLIAVVMLVRLTQSSDALEAETARLASAALGQSVTAATAAGALDTRIGETPGASGSPFPPLAALYQQLQAVPGARLTSVSYRVDGTLTASVAAGRVEDINRLLLALQRSGYRVTATTGSGPGGQLTAEVALRSAE